MRSYYAYFTDSSGIEYLYVVLDYSLAKMMFLIDLSLRFEAVIFCSKDGC